MKVSETQIWLMTVTVSMATMILIVRLLVINVTMLVMVMILTMKMATTVLTVRLLLITLTW